MAEYRLSPKARRDLSQIFDYTVSQWGVAQAMAYTDRIDAVCTSLAQAPQQAQACAHIRAGYRRRGVAQHVIYFRVAAYGIAVIRILHQSMDAGRQL